MNDTAFYGFLELGKELEKLEELDVFNEEEIIAQEFVEDLLKLPKPRSEISKAGYTHLIDSFSYQRKKSEIEIGWGKYYGPILERGSRKMKNAHPHLKPTWNKNVDRYINNLKKRNNLI